MSLQLGGISILAISSIKELKAKKDQLMKENNELNTILTAIEAHLETV